MINKAKIDNINVYHIPHTSKLVTFGIATINGSNFENKENAGISHFAEHMFFKGTPTRTWKDINYEFARNGASNNAFTCNTEVFYYASCPIYNVNNIVNLMMDMFFNSLYPKDELEKERNVIIEEKKSYVDDPNSYFAESIGENLLCWQLGHPTIGEFETINKISQESLLKYLCDTINYNNLAFVCCGDINFDSLCSCIRDNLPKNGHPFLKFGNKNEVGPVFWKDGVKKENNIGLRLSKEGAQQAHVGKVFKGISLLDSRFAQISVVLRAVGGGSYSMLYERIREELGLCYSIYLTHFTLAFPNSIAYHIGGETSTENVDLFIEESEKIIKEVAKNGISSNLFECSKNSLLSALLSASETTMGTMSFMLEKMLFDNFVTMDEKIEAIKNVSLEDCNKISEEIFSSDGVWAVMTEKTDQTDETNIETTTEKDVKINE